MVHTARDDTARDDGRGLAAQPPPTGPWRRIGMVALAAIVGAATLASAPLGAGMALAQWAPGPDITVDEITDNPEPFYGDRVTVRGEIGEVLGPRAFAVEDDDLLFDEQLLVVGRPGQVSTVGLLPGDDIWVAGTVRRFALVDVEREIGYDLDDALYVRFAGLPAIVATSVRPAEDGSDVPPAVMTTPREPDATICQPPAGRDSQVSLPQIARSPGTLRGQPVMIDGRVDRIVGDRVFTLGTGADRILVVTRGPGVSTVAVRSGQDVRVVGSAHAFNERAFEDRLEFDLPIGLAATWGGRSAVIVTCVGPLAAR